MNGYPWKPGEVEVRPTSDTCFDIIVRGKHAGVIVGETPERAAVLAHSLADYARCAASAEWVDETVPVVLGGEG